MSNLSWFGLPLYTELESGDSKTILEPSQFLGVETEGEPGSFVVSEVPTSSADRFNISSWSEIDVGLGPPQLSLIPEVRIGRVLESELDISFSPPTPDLIPEFLISAKTRRGIVQLHYPLNTVWMNTSPHFNPLTNVGHAQIVSNVGVFGDGSAYFDGSGDRYWTDPGLSFGLDDFTIEFWLYLRNGGTNWARIIAFGADATQGSVYILRNNNLQSIVLNIYNSGSYLRSSPVIPMTYEEFTHITVCRSSGVFRTFKNGITIGENSSYTGFQITQSLLSVGNNTENTVSFFGNITDLRITYGKALYTEDFTPPGRHTPKVIGNPVIRNVLNYGCGHDSTLAIPQDTRVNEVLIQTDDTRAGFTDTILRGERTSTHRFSGNKTITGILTRVGIPIPGAEVSLYERRSLQLVDTVSTNEEGIFSFSHINRESDLYIIANDPMGELLPASDEAGNNLNLHQSKMKVELGGKTLSGTIGIGGVRVFIYDWSTKILVSQSVTDIEGKWSVEVPTGEYMITYLSENCRPVTHGPYSAV